MAKLYTRRVDTCWACPDLVENRWCRVTHTEIYDRNGIGVMVSQMPPADCPLPDAPEPEVKG